MMVGAGSVSMCQSFKTPVSEELNRLYLTQHLSTFLEFFS
jgi:hypothetical protein